MAIVKTRLIITPTNQDFTIPGDRSVDFIKQNYESSIPGVSGMVATDVVEGDTRILTFSNRTGTKG